MVASVYFKQNKPSKPKASLGNLFEQNSQRLQECAEEMNNAEKMHNFLKSKIRNQPLQEQPAINYSVMHQSIPAAPIPPPGQLRGICTHCQSRGSGISLPKGYPRAFDTHVVSDSKSKQRRFYRKRPVVCH